MIKRGGKPTQWETSMTLGSFDWIDNRLEGERQFLRIVGMGGAMAGGMMVGFFPMIVMLMVSIFLRRDVWGPSLMVTVGIPLTAIGAVVGAVLLARHMKKNCPRRVGIGTNGVMFEDHKQRMTFVGWDDMTTISPLYYNKFGECMLSHGRSERKQRGKLLTSGVVGEIQAVLEKRGYQNTPQGLVVKPIRSRN